MGSISDHALVQAGTVMGAHVRVIATWGTNEAASGVVNMVDGPWRNWGSTRVRRTWRRFSGLLWHISFISGKVFKSSNMSENYSRVTYSNQTIISFVNKKSKCIVVKVVAEALWW